MNKKELAEAIKLIYDSLNDEDNINELKQKISKQRCVIKKLCYALMPIVKQSHFSFVSVPNTYDLKQYVDEFLKFNPMNLDFTEIDGDFIDKLVEDI